MLISLHQNICIYGRLLPTHQFGLFRMKFVSVGSKYVLCNNLLVHAKTTKNNIVVGVCYVCVVGWGMPI